MDEIINVPKNKAEFEYLKNMVQWPKYSKDCEIPWKDLSNIEKCRREFSKAKVKQELSEGLENVKENTDLKGLLIVYINVGTLAPNVAEAVVDRIQAKYEVLKRIPLDYGVIWLPVRSPTQTHVELFSFKNN